MIEEISTKEISEYLKKNSNSILVDVRREEEWNNDGKPDGDKLGIKTYFLTIVDDNFSEEFKKLNISKDKKILIMCAAGARSQVASELLTFEGYTCVNVYDGFLGHGNDGGWKRNKLPIK
tara:strand:+ start:948 stop:1307 length:360 start_codon:yes stop_codon:yes gene_type:complete